MIGHLLGIFSRVVLLRGAERPLPTHAHLSLVPGQSRGYRHQQTGIYQSGQYLSSFTLYKQMPLGFLSLAFSLSLLVLFQFSFALSCSRSPFNQEAPIKCDLRSILDSWSFLPCWSRGPPQLVPKPATPDNVSVTQRESRGFRTRHTGAVASENHPGIKRRIRIVH